MSTIKKALDISEVYEDQTSSSCYTSQSPSELQPLLTPSSTIVSYKAHEIQLLSKNWRDSNWLKLQILTCFLNMFLMGMNGQTIGSLIPAISQEYRKNESYISLIFILQFLGYTLSAIFIDSFHLRIGRRGVLTLANFMVCLACLVNSLGPPFIVFVSVYFLCGLGVGLMDSCMNVFISSLEDHNELMGILHGCFGIGGIVAPVLISYLLKCFDGDFRVHYFLMMILGLVSGLFSFLSFKTETKLKYEYEVSLKAHDEEELQEVSLRKILSNKVVLMCSLYLFLYSGTETSTGSWLISYLMKVKHLTQMSAGYAVSSFWIGVTSGRVILGFITSRYFRNEYNATLFYSLVALLTYLVYTTFTLLVPGGDWFQLVTELNMLVAGLFMAPLFPTTTITLMKTLPMNMRVSSMGIVCIISGSGGAILPFIIGLITHVTKLDYLPIFISVMATGYVVTLLLIPKVCKLEPE